MTRSSASSEDRSGQGLSPRRSERNLKDDDVLRVLCGESSSGSDYLRFAPETRPAPAMPAEGSPTMTWLWKSWVFSSAFSIVAPSQPSTFCQLIGGITPA